MIFPWHQKQWQRLLNAKQHDRFPHALLLLGMQGVGKKEFAKTLASTLLCSFTNEQGNNCQQCHACHLLQAGSHPDYLMIEPESAGQVIKIDQIREVVSFVNETSSQGGYKVIIINPANAMNANAANALLKTLEEPSVNTVLLLISQPYSRLPATIASRCQKIIFSKPSEEEAMQWLTTQLSDQSVDAKLLLNLAEGAPLLARDLAMNETMVWRQDLYQGLLLLSQKKADPLALSAKWQQMDLLVLLALLLSWLKDLLRYKMTYGAAEVTNTDYQAVFSELADKIEQKNLLNYIEQVQRSYATILNSLNLNHQLVLEELLIKWTHYAAS